MIIILSLLAITALCLGIHLLTDDDEAIWGGIGFVALIILVLVVCLILPISRMEVQADIRAFRSVGLSLETARANPDISEFELAAIQQEVIDANRWLAKAKYLVENPLINWFWVKDVIDLEPIK